MIEERVKQISSGSKDGNAYLVDDNLLIDCGCTRIHLEPYLDKVKVIFCSHLHEDHSKSSTIKSIAQGTKRYKAYPKIKFAIGEFLEDKMLSLGVDPNNLIIMKENVIYNMGIFKLSPVILYHDVPVFGLRVITNDNYKVVYLSDTFHLDGIKAKDYDVYILEYNHCEIEVEKYIKEQDELDNGFNYVKGSQHSHLSFQKADKFMVDNAKNGSRIMRVHLSSRYNEDNYDLDFIYTK